MSSTSPVDAPTRYGSRFPGNWVQTHSLAMVARTASSGAGSQFFEMQTGLEAPGLGCGQNIVGLKERELSAALAKLKTPPKLVVTDSQAFLKVAADKGVDGAGRREALLASLRREGTP